MDNQEIYVAPQCNEDCLDMVLPFEKEEVSRYQLPVPDAPMVNAAFMNMSDSFPVTEKVSPFTTSIPMVSKPVHAFNFMSNSSIGSNLSAPLNNHQTQVPRSARFKLNGTFPVRNQPVSVSSSASIYRNHLVIDRSTNQRSHVFRYTSTPCFGSIPFGNKPTHARSSVISSMLQPNIYKFKRSQPTDISTPPSTSQFCYDSIARKLAYNPQLGCISFVGPNVSFSMGNQQISSSSFAKSPFCDSHGCLTSRDQLDLNLAMTSNPCTGGNDFRSLSEVPQCSLPNLLVGQISSPIFPINHDSYKTCSECGKKFPTFHALGGHISAHAKARNRLAKMTRLLYASDKDSSIVLPGYGDGSSATPNASILTSAVTHVKIEGFNYSNVVKEGFSSSLVEEIGLENFSSSEETVRKGSSISSN